MRTIERLSLGVLLILSQAIACPAEDPAFDHRIPTDAVRFVTAFSPDSQAITFIFDNLSVETEVGQGGLPSVSEKKFAYVLSVDAENDAAVTQDFRGYVSTAVSGSACLVVHASGQSTTVDLNEAIAAAKRQSGSKPSETSKQARLLAEKQGFNLQSPADTSEEFFFSITSQVAKGAPLQTTLVLIADRLPGDDGSSGLLVIDTIDCAVKKLDGKAN